MELRDQLGKSARALVAFSCSLACLPDLACLYDFACLRSFLSTLDLQTIPPLFEGGLLVWPSALVSLSGEPGTSPCHQGSLQIGGVPSTAHAQTNRPGLPVFGTSLVVWSQNASPYRCWVPKGQLSCSGVPLRINDQASGIPIFKKPVSVAFRK